MKCYKCTKRIVLHAFSKGICVNCGEELVSTCTPANKLCSKCATIHNELCECCGKKIIEFKEEDIQKEIINEVGIKLTHKKTGLTAECSSEELLRWNESRAKSKLYSMLEKLDL